MNTEKSSRNKTIDIAESEGKEYLSRCIHLRKKAALDEVLDRIIIGDCFKVLKKLPEHSVDLLVVDPPYNLTKDYHGSVFRHTDDATYRQFTLDWIDAVKPLLKKTAAVYVCCDWASGMIIGPVLKEHFILRNRITWQREKGRGSNSNWKSGMEDIWFATCSEEYTFHIKAVMQRKRVHAPYRKDGAPKDWEETAEGRFRNTHPSNFWDDISVPYWSMAENTAHPTQKPEKLIAKLILANTDPGGVVLDPFCGSGTTAVTAKKLGRHFIGIEQNTRYCIWAQKRLEDAEKNPQIQGYRGGVFWERNAYFGSAKPSDSTK